MTQQFCVIESKRVGFEREKKVYCHRRNEEKTINKLDNERFLFAVVTSFFKMCRMRNVKEN